MLSYLKGRVLENALQSSNGTVTLGVGTPESGFVGYSVHVPRNPAYELLAEDRLVEFFIYTHVREDSLDLYGFASRLEKELFLTLLNVNGIGPKGALGILSGAEPARLIEAIIEGEKGLLTKIPGIGKKTAERVVLELSEPLKKKFGQGSPALSKGPSGASAQGSSPAQANQAQRDAVSALVGLGFHESDVTAIVSNAAAESSARKTAPKAEDLIKAALRQLS